MECQHKEKCLNHPEKCNACGQISDMYNHYPLLKIRDLVEVVRCKDCQYGRGNDYEGSIKVPFMYFCTYDDFSYNNADHFCSYGKRKEGAEE